MSFEQFSPPTMFSPSESPTFIELDASPLYVHVSTEVIWMKYPTPFSIVSDELSDTKLCFVASYLYSSSYEPLNDVSITFATVISVSLVNGSEIRFQSVTSSFSNVPGVGPSPPHVNVPLMRIGSTGSSLTSHIPTQGGTCLQSGIQPKFSSFVQYSVELQWIVKLPTSKSAGPFLGNQNENTIQSIVSLQQLPSSIVHQFQLPQLGSIPVIRSVFNVRFISVQ